MFVLLSPAPFYTCADTLAVITAADIDQYRKDFLSKIYIEGLITGNVEAEVSCPLSALRSAERLVTGGYTNLGPSRKYPECAFPIAIRTACRSIASTSPRFVHTVRNKCQGLIVTYDFDRKQHHKTKTTR